MMTEQEAHESVVQIFREVGHNREASIKLLTLKIMMAYNQGALDVIDQLGAKERLPRRSALWEWLARTWGSTP